ncbi:MAG: hypothetical protein ABEJ56_05765 [Candidatus Nanohaloarchaea archaeon]
MTGSNIKVPKYAEKNARKGVKLRKEKFSESNRPVLSQKEARKKGVHSGMTTAKTLQANDYISKGMAERIYSYLSRNKGQKRTDKVKVARLVWGGDESGRFQKYLKKRLDK